MVEIIHREKAVGLRSELTPWIAPASVPLSHLDRTLLMQGANTSPGEPWVPVPDSESAGGRTFLTIQGRCNAWRRPGYLTWRTRQPAVYSAGIPAAGLRQDELEVRVNTGRKLLLVATMISLAVSAWAQSAVTDEIRPIGDLRRGEFVVVRGEVIRFRDHDEIRLQDATGRVDVYLGEQRRTRPPFRIGDTITVAGWVDDDLFEFPKEIYASEIILNDGTVLSVGDQGWE